MNTEILNTMSQQIGRMNIAAISGGRRVAVDERTLRLPVSNGYHVEVELMIDDTYTVRRVTIRKAKGIPVRKIKGEVSGVYCDEVGEAAYQASSFRSYEFGEVPA